MLGYILQFIVLQISCSLRECLLFIVGGGGGGNHRGPGQNNLFFGGSPEFEE